MIILEMPDHGLNGGTTAHLAADGLGDAPDLATDPDLKPVGIVVAAIALVAMDATDRDACDLFKIGDDRTEGMAIVRAAVQRFGVQHELPLLGGDRRANGDLAGRTRTQSAPCRGRYTLPRGHGTTLIELWPALALVLMANPQRGRAARRSGFRVLCCPRSCDECVTGDAAEPGSELQFPPGAFELVGVRVAPRGSLGHAQIAPGSSTSCPRSCGGEEG